MHRSLYLRGMDQFSGASSIEAVWGHERDVQSNTLDVFIRQLRTKIEPSGTSKLLHTIRGIGYSLREEEGL